VLDRVSFYQQFFWLYLNMLDSTDVDMIHLAHDIGNQWTHGSEKKHHMSHDMSDFPLPAS
jgi:hypothetical protein